MNIENIATILGALGGFEFAKWAVERWAGRKYNRRKYNADADKAEQEADDAIIKSYENRIASMTEQHEHAVHSYEERLKELRDCNSELNTSLLTHVKEKARKDEIIDDKIGQIRKVNEELVATTRQMAKLERDLQYYKSWKCFREYGKGKGECTRREPKQNPPLKFSPLNDIEAAN